MVEVNRAALTAAAFSLLLAPTATLHAAAFVLGDRPKGLGPPPIVVAKDAPPRTRDAAAALADYVSKISGAKPAVTDDQPHPLSQRTIWVGYQPLLKTLFPATSFDFQNPEETLILASATHLVICGRDRTVGATQIEHGSSNAVYAFLEKELGVRWLWPGLLGTEIPKADRLAWAPFERRFHPPFRYRLLWPQNPADWHRAQRLLDHSLRFEAGHAFTDWWDKYHAEHPDYFAQLPNGTRQPRRDPRDVKLQVEILRSMKQLRLTGAKDPADVRRAEALCAARDALFKRYNGLAVRRSKWYVDSRGLADYVGPPSAAMRKGASSRPDTAPDMKAKD